MTSKALELNHLAPSMRKIALLSKEERVKRVLADRWLGYTKAEAAVNKLESLIAHPKRQRMPNLLISGPTNNGKSMIIEKFRRTHLLAPVYGPCHEGPLGDKLIQSTPFCFKRYHIER